MTDRSKQYLIIKSQENRIVSTTKPIIETDVAANAIRIIPRG